MAVPGGSYSPYMRCTNGYGSPDGQKFWGECGAPIAPPHPTVGAPADVDAVDAPSEPTVPFRLAHSTHGSDAVDESATRSSHRSRRRIWVTLIATGVAIVAIAAGGAIVGGDRTFVDFVPTGGSAAVEITSFSDLPAPAGTEVYAELSNLSLLGT